MRFNFTPKDILRLIKQRLFWFAIPFALIAILGLIAISRLPDLYVSEADLIVEGPQVPDDLVASTVAAEEEERLRIVRSQVMARDNLIRIGERFGVFGTERLTRTEKDEWMTERATMTVEVDDDRRRRRDEALISTKISFKDGDPRIAQSVANELVTQFEGKVIEVRSEQAGETTEFLQEEERKVRRALNDISDQVSVIKSENPTALPDNRSLYESTIQRLAIDRDRTDANIEQVATDLQQLKMLEPTFTSSELSPREQQLANLRSELQSARRQYTETYPGVIALKGQVLDLERDLDPQAFRKNARAEINELGRQLANERKGSADYAALEERLTDLRQQLRDTPANATSDSPGQVSFRGQVFALESRQESLARQRENLDRQIADMEARIGALPEVENRLFALVEEQERLGRELTQLQSKRASAERSQSLVQQAKGGRIVAINRPVLPDEPSSPDKPKLALGIFVLAAGLAGLVVLIPEILFAKVQSKEHLSSLLPDVPIVEVPRFKTADERLPKLVATASLTAATVVLAVALSWTAFQTLT